MTKRCKRNKEQMLAKTFTIFFMCWYQNDLAHIFYMPNLEYDLIIIGGGGIGVAAAYYALKKGWKICIVDPQGIQDQKHYWTSSLSARQNRVQYNEEYLTRFVMKSNQEWHNLENELTTVESRPTFLHHEGTLWFGNKNVTTSQGNIKAANAVINQINEAAKTKKEKIKSILMQKLMEDVPSFMKAFKPYDVDDNSIESEWDSWSSLFQPDGGSVDMNQSFSRLRQYINNKVDAKDQTQVTAHKKINGIHQLDLKTSKNEVSKISGYRLFICVGVNTPQFLKNVMSEGHLADHQKTEFVIQEYVTSYIKVEDTPQAYEVYDNIPSFYNFLEGSRNMEAHETEFSGYGFRFHQWDNLSQNKEIFVNLGTMAFKSLSLQDLRTINTSPVTTADRRVIAVKRYIRDRMNYLEADHPNNKHFPFPMIFYSGRQTLLDYLNRTDNSIVVQSGGWTDKYYPLLAKTAIDMLFSYEETQKLRQSGDVIGNFINRTRFPITSRVNDILSSQKTSDKQKFTNVVIGAGCSGLYAAYRLNRERKEHPDKAKEIGNIGVFQLSDRISGRLKSFKFEGTTTPMELGGMRYIPTNHILVNKVITDLGIPSINFSMNGDPIQQAARLAYLRNDYYRMNEWSTTQGSNLNLHTAYRIEGPIVGMDSFQILSFSLYMILTAPENINLLPEVFLSKTEIQIKDQKKRLAQLGENVHVQASWYRNWKNYIYQDRSNSKSYIINLSLSQWNQLKPILLFRFRFGLTDRQVYQGQQEVNLNQTYPLYKFGFQNVIEAQFSHQAYQFVSQQNGYFSNTSNASYLDQVMTYLLDFGNVSYRTLASGFDQINYAMANDLLSQGGLDFSKEGIFLHHKLVDILPGDKQHKYILVFHVPRTKARRSVYSKTKLHLCKQRGQKANVPKLGERIPIPGNDDYDEVQFGANRIILGMPKKSITNLAHEIDLLRVPIQENYQEIYNHAKNEFYQTFNYTKTSDTIAEAKETPPLTTQQQEQLKKLLLQQQKFFNGEREPLTHLEVDRLNFLSHIKFIQSVEPVRNPEVEREKIQKFDRDSPLAPKDLFNLADAAQLMPAMKIVMNFNCNWWDPDIRMNRQYGKNLINSVEEMRGVSVTDLPARQTLYFSNGPDNLLLASYNDMITTEFWTTLHNNFTQVWRRDQTNLLRGREVINRIYPESMDIHPAKTVLVKQVLKQLSLMHQIQVKEQWVKECIYQFWGNDPYGAGYHNFYSGFYIPAVMRCIRKPWSNQNIHFVGEAYSNETGWVEGAFQTTELLLQRELGLSEFVARYYAGY